jgi:hypothetical protein
MTGKLIPPTKAIITQINAAHDAVVESGKSSLTNAIRAGELLVSAKECVEHGEWTQWLADNCPNISEETARLYMRLAKNEDKIEKAAEQNGNAVADLSVRGAAKLISKKREGATVKKKGGASPDLPTLLKNVGPDELSIAIKQADWAVEEIRKLITKLTVQMQSAGAGVQSSAPTTPKSPPIGDAPQRRV